MSDFWLDPSSTSILYVCEQRRLTRLRLWAGSPEPSLVAYVISSKYHNLMSWLKCSYWFVQTVLLLTSLVFVDVFWFVSSQILQLYASIQQKEPVILSGPSGSGKSTSLNILARALNRLNALLFAPDHSKDELTTERDFMFYVKNKLQVCWQN